MLNSQDYMMSWLTYMAGAIGLLVVWWFITRKIRLKVLKDILRIVAATLLLVPYPVLNQEEFLAPAMGMSFLEAIFGQSEGFSRAGFPVLIVLAFVIALYLIIDTVWVRFRQHKLREKQEQQQLMQEHDELVVEAKGNEP